MKLIVKMRMLSRLTFYMQDQAGQPPGQTDWNGVVGSSQSEVQAATSNSPSCDQKENSADLGDLGDQVEVDPVAKAIEQRSYR